MADTRKAKTPRATVAVAVVVRSMGRAAPLGASTRARTKADPRAGASGKVPPPTAPEQKGGHERDAPNTSPEGSGTTGGFRTTIGA